MSSMKKHIIFIAFLFVSSLSMAQSQRTALEEYEAFKRRTTKEYNDFRDRVNAEYVKFMRESWALYNGEKPIPKPVSDEPVVPPVVMPEEDRGRIPETNPVPFDEVAPVPVPSPCPKPVVPVKEDLRPAEQWIDLDFYGTPCRLRFREGDKVFLGNTMEDAVADMWERMGRTHGNLVYDCHGLREKMDLCDWAYMKLSEAVAARIYGPEHPDESVMLQSFVLNQSGFKLHIARSDDNSLHLLMAAECDMYGFPYWDLDNEHYYLTDGSDAESLYIFTQSFPEEQPMRLAVAHENRFAEKPSPDRFLQSEQFPEMNATLTVNENLIAFYNEYPASYANNDHLSKWLFYAQTPLCKMAKDRLYPMLRNAVSGKNEQDAANMLLNFVQTAFVYEYDDNVWGRDRAFFADETLYYPYSDCEDRAILFSRIVRDIMGLPVALVYYPGHLAAAVRFNGYVPGDYLNVSGNHYTICDPTYIHAPIGLTMPGMDNAEAKVILLD